MPVISKCDSREQAAILSLSAQIEEQTKTVPLTVSALSMEGIDQVRERLARLIPEDFDARTITGDFVGKEDLVMLVMPQDIQAPKGRLILPQVQTIRELLDKKCCSQHDCESNDKRTESACQAAKAHYYGFTGISLCI